MLSDNNTFEIDSPKFSVTPDARDIEKRLRKAGIAYTVAAKGYITFEGNVFGSDVPLLIGLRFDRKVIHDIEIFRPSATYSAENCDIDASFEELSGIIRKKFGAPTEEDRHPSYGKRDEKWELPGYTIHHFIWERFVWEERLHVSFTV